MPTDSTPLFRELSAAVLKIAVTVIALVYPCIVTAIARNLNVGHVVLQ
jgi:hypothetical protein